MNKKVKFISIIIVVCIIILVGVFIFTKQYNQSEPSSNQNQSEPLSNQSQTEQSSNQVEYSNLEEMKDQELADLFYEISKGDEFVNETEKNYRLGHEKVADTAEDAVEYTRIKDSDEDELLELKLQAETEFYYVVYQEYVSHRGTGDVTFKNSYVYFKSSILNIDNETINTDILNSASKVKEFFDLYAYLKDCDNGSVKLLSPEITENPNEYIYSYYYFETTYGDWGLNDAIELYKATISINKKNGKVKTTEKIIRQVTGKLNESDLQF